MASHVRTTLVQRTDCRIERCSCGVYHVSIGAVTLRLGAAQVASVFEALGHALAPTVAADEDGDPRVH